MAINVKLIKLSEFVPPQYKFPQRVYKKIGEAVKASVIDNVLT